MKRTRKLTPLQRRMRQLRSAPARPATEADVRRTIREEIARLPRLRLELPQRRRGCG